MRIEHAVDVAVAVFDALDDLRLAHHAAAEEDLLLRMPGLGVDQRADVAVDAGLRVLADGAGVDDDAVRALLLVHDAVAARLQYPADALGVGLVLLTAVGIDKGPGRDALRKPVFFDFFTDLTLRAKQLGRDLGGFPFQGATSDILVILYYTRSADIFQRKLCAVRR